MKSSPATVLPSLIATLAVLALSGCTGTEETSEEAPPVFSLAWSEYPSWSVFGVAHIQELIDKDQGKLSAIEKKWNVDIVLQEADYETCIMLYGASEVDAACLTNMDALSPSLSVPSVMILPTSTSDGADACIVVDSITNVTQLRGKEVHGLEKTVSEYCFVRNLELLGEKESDHRFVNMDPANAAVAMQTKEPTVEAIVVWNPFVMQTLAKRDDVKVLFDSTSIPNEIIDAVIMSQSSLDKPGGENFACALIDAFYAVNRSMADPATADETLADIGAKFASLELEDMKTVVKQTKFFSDPEQGKGLLTGSELPEIMKKVVAFCMNHDMVDREPKIGYDSQAEADLRFDATYIEKVQTDL